MATYEKRSGSIRVKVELRGVRLSKTFATKTEARAWATTTEKEILDGKGGVLPDKPFSALLERRAESMDPKRNRADIIRLDRIARQDSVAKIKLAELSTMHVAVWREERLAKVSAASVRREWTLLSAACTVAVVEWKWLKENPFRAVKRPPKPDNRDRLPSATEIALIKHVSGYDEDSELRTMTSRVAAAFLFAIETGMRIGEIVNLRKEDVHEDFVRLTGVEVGARKTRGSKRDVGLSVEAVRILNQLTPHCKAGEKVFRLSSTQNVDGIWRTKIIAKTPIKGLHFHDSRHAAITQLAHKIEILDLARMVGMTDLKTLMVYYNATASDISKRINAA